MQIPAEGTSDPRPRSFHLPLPTWLTGPKVTWSVLALLLVLVWGPRLFRSLWVDETCTFWLAHQGVVAAVEKTWHWPPQSILYSVIETPFCFHGGPFRDFMLRVPTLIGMLAAGYFVYRLAEDAIGRGSGFVAAALFAFHPQAIRLGSQARPYGLAVAAVAGSCWMLYRWVETRERRSLVGYVVASTLIVYLHYFFAPVFLVHAAYVLFVFAMERRNGRWREFVAALVAIGLLALPLVPHMLMLLHEAHEYIFMPAPSVAELADQLLPSIFAVGPLAAAFLVQLAFPGALKPPVALRQSFLFLLLVWWLFGPLLFFAFSRATPMHVFVARYIAFSFPGQVLLLAYAGYCVFGRIEGRVWAVLAVLLSTASPLSMLAAHETAEEELLPFVRIIRSESAQGAPPVLFRSEFQESNSLDWRGGTPETSRLYAPFVAYPIRNPLVLLPYHLTDDVKAYISSTIDSTLANLPEVIFVTHDNTGVDWMIERMGRAGFQAHTKKPNSFTVVIFKRPAG